MYTMLKKFGPLPRNPVRPWTVLLAGLALITALLLAGCHNTDNKKQDDKPTPTPTTFSPTHKGGDPIWGGTNGAAEATNTADN
jgi:hypothetical protein